MASRAVLVFGATGTIGKPIVTELIKHRSSFDRLVIFTSLGGLAEKKALLDSWKAAGAEIIEGDVANKEQVLKAYEGILFSMVYTYKAIHILMQHLLTYP